MRVPTRGPSPSIRLSDVRFLSDTTCFIANEVRIRRRLVPHNSAIKIRPSASIVDDTRLAATRGCADPRVIFARRCIRLGITPPAPPPPPGSNGPATRRDAARNVGRARDKIARDVRGIPVSLSQARRDVSEAKIQSFPSHSGRPPRAPIRDVIFVPCRAEKSLPVLLPPPPPPPFKEETFLFILEFPCQ